MAKTFKEVMADAGISMDFQACGTAPVEMVNREILIEPHERVKKLKAIFMQTLSSANNEFTYWYTREYMKLDNEIPVVRRAQAPEARFLPPDAGDFPR